jgi:hypothetical protein
VAFLSGESSKPTAGRSSWAQQPSTCAELRATIRMLRTELLLMQGKIARDLVLGWNWGRRALINDLSPKVRRMGIGVTQQTILCPGIRTASGQG